MQFSSLSRLFSVVHEHRLKEYSKCRAYQTLFKIILRYKTIKWNKNKRNKFFIMLKRNSINVHSNTRHSSYCKFGTCRKWEPAGRIGDFGNFLNGFAKSQRLIVLNIDWVQFKRLVYTPSDLLARICKVNLSNAKKFGVICFPRICFRGLIYCDLECDRRCLLFFGCTYKAINSM